MTLKQFYFIHNTYIAPNPIRLAQSTSQFKTNSVKHTHIHTHTHTHSHACMHARTLSQSHTHTHTHTLVCYRNKAET